MEREICRFSVWADDGREFVLIEYATIRSEVEMLSGAHQVENRIRRLETTDGQSVSPTGSENEYLIVALNLRVRIKQSPHV